MSRQRIVEAAVELAEGRGLERFTMRDLAAELGVGTMSIYHHLPDKRALHQAMADHIWSQLVLPAPDAPWDRRLAHLTTQLWEAARRHPALVPLLLTRRFTGPEALPAVEALLAAAADAGFDPPETATCFRILVGFAVGLAQAEVARTVAEREHGPARLGGGDDGGDAFPRLRAALAGPPVSPEAEFEFGLEVVLSGLRRRTGT
ncbi:MAG: TetR/AcrR family transcriptional regulator [Acidimicrobiales bacterium]